MIGARRGYATLLTGALLVSTASLLGAQITGSLAVSAVVLARPLAGVGVRSLQFGVLVPGTPTVIAPNSAQGGEYRLSGVKSRKSVDISFTLPASLTGPNGATIPLNFNGNTAGVCEVDTSNTCVAASFFTWNPVTTPSYRDTPTRYKPGRKVYAYDLYSVYIGGTATPAAGQKPGTYTGAIGIVLAVN
ncbi:MAG: hypothetical protein M3Z05_15670 [Gemmatimonadota bacterium]|nr:hypothetical protein [Gemmatimonadota bacterium]